MALSLEQGNEEEERPDDGGVTLELGVFFLALIKK